LFLFKTGSSHQILPDKAFHGDTFGGKTACLNVEFVENGLEGVWFVAGEVGEDFAVEIEVRVVERVDEATIREV
jgi:hypothetical protein